MILDTYFNLKLILLYNKSFCFNNLKSKTYSNAFYYKIYKATYNFRGTDIITYFTHEIPIAFGSWKFNGLPGLMVEMNDTQGIYTWQLTSYKPNTEIDIGLKEIQEKNSKFEIITFKNFDVKIINKRKELFLIISSRNENRNLKYSFDTFQDKEPINEWRTQNRWVF